MRQLKPLRASEIYPDSAFGQMQVLSEFLTDRGFEKKEYDKGSVVYRKNGMEVYYYIHDPIVKGYYGGEYVAITFPDVKGYYFVNTIGVAVYGDAFPCAEPGQRMAAMLKCLKEHFIEFCDPVFCEKSNEKVWQYYLANMEMFMEESRAYNMIWRGVLFDCAEEIKYNYYYIKRITNRYFVAHPYESGFCAYDDIFEVSEQTAMKMAEDEKYGLEICDILYRYSYDCIMGDIPRIIDMSCKGSRK